VRHLVGLLLALAACAEGRVVVRGQEMPVSQAEGTVAADLATERAAIARLSPANRAAKLEGFAARYPGVPAAAEALHEAARLWRGSGDPARAALAYQRLLVDHPLHRDSTAAKYELALCDLELGRTRDGLANLSSLYPRLPEASRAQAARAAAEGAERAKALPEAARWWSEASTRGAPADREAALRRATDLVESRLSPLEVARLREALPSDAPVLPATLARLSKLQLQAGDRRGAEESARELAERHPGAPQAAEARLTLDRLSRATTSRPGVIGVAVPLSGELKRWGEVVVQGLQLALGEDGPLRLVVRDTRGEPEGAAAAIEQLVLDEGAVAVVGGVTNAEADRAAAAAEGLGVPLLSLSKKSDITAARPHVFQHMLTAEAQAKALADLLMGKRGMTRFAILYPTVAYGTELANAFWDQVEARGGEIRAVESYPIDKTTFTPLVKDMVGRLYLDERPEYGEAARAAAAKETDPLRRRKALEKARDAVPPIVDFDAVLIADFAKNVKLIAPALAVEDVPLGACQPGARGRKGIPAVMLFGGNGWGADPTLFETGPGGAGRYLRCSIFVDGFWAQAERPETRRFVEAYQARFGAPPTILEAYAYDAARLLQAALAARPNADREGLREALGGLKNVKAATGDLTVGPKRLVEKELFYLTADQDGVRELTPAERAAGGWGGAAF